MLIKESTLRRIIREEAVRVLREDDAPISTAPVSQPNSSFSVADPGKPVTVNIKRPAGYVNPNAPVVPLAIEAAPAAAYKKINSDFKKLMIAAWDPFAKSVALGQTSVVNFQFQINKDGSVDPNTIKVTCTPDFTIPAAGSNPTHTFSSDIKKTIARWKFDPVTEAFIYEHPKGLEFNSKEY